MSSTQDEKPAVITPYRESWYRDGVLIRESAIPEIKTKQVPLSEEFDRDQVILTRKEQQNFRLRQKYYKPSHLYDVDNNDRFGTYYHLNRNDTTPNSEICCSHFFSYIHEESSVHRIQVAEREEQKEEQREGQREEYVEIMTHLWYKNDSKLLHREDGPAVIEVNKNGVILSQKWFKNGVEYNIPSPASKVTFHPNGEKSTERWFVNEKRHRLDGPAVIKYFSNGIKASEVWYKDDMIYRDTLPTIIMYHPNGNIKSESWLFETFDKCKGCTTYSYKRDSPVVVGSETLPHFISYHSNGVKKSEYFPESKESGSKESGSPIYRILLRWFNQYKEVESKYYSTFIYFLLSKRKSILRKMVLCSYVLSSS